MLGIMSTEGHHFLSKQGINGFRACYISSQTENGVTIQTSTPLPPNKAEGGRDKRMTPLTCSSLSSKMAYTEYASN